MIKIVTLRAFADNFIYLLVDPAGAQAAVIDPGEAEPVLRALNQNGLTLTHVLLTHHHPDHVGGAAALAAEFGAEVCCSLHDRARLAVATRALSDGEQFTLFDSPVEVIATPGHTLGQINYRLPREGAVFTGDTLFSAGCGRLFEGTAAQMFESMRRLDALPSSTAVYFGHEYTLNNIDFVTAHVAYAREPEALARDVESYRAHCRARLAEGQPTTPSTLEIERAINPFLTAPDVAAFARWREARNHWGT